MADTGIEWSEKVWNPVTGCTKVSTGCRSCYAEGVAERFWATQYPEVVTTCAGPNGQHSVTAVRPRLFTDVQCHEDRLDQPLRWRKPRRIFVNSMSDLYHEDVPDEFIDNVFAVMALTPQHTYQILTKRAERMRAYMMTESPDGDRCDHVAATANELMSERDGRLGITFIKRGSWPLPNVWLGVSVENQYFADERIPLLLQTPAATRFISAEPLLGPLYGLDQWLLGGFDSRPMWTAHCPVDESGFAHIPGLDWVIVGGESGGPKARPCDLAWIRSIVAQCKAAGVSCFVKQLGTDPRTNEPTVWPNGRITPYPFLHPHLKDRKGGDPEEWPADLRVRDFPGLAGGEGARR